VKITEVESEVHALALSRPYTIAFRHIDSIEVVSVRLHGERGLVGLGAASPEPHVTAETNQMCQEALEATRLDWLVGEDVTGIDELCAEIARCFENRPAARAAVDIAVHDLLAKSMGMALVDMFGRVHQALPTSVTIGILPVDETVAEASELVAAGFRVLKIKLGHSLAEDLDRLSAVRGHISRDVRIRVDPNQGYSAEELLRFVADSRELDIEFIEQPMKADATDALRAMPEDVRALVAADESLLSSADALALAAPPRACGVFNIKLMKCGGIDEARRIAAVAAAANIGLMWGCMDESVISIAGALHTALACRATRYLDLDGSFDLAHDIARGGLVLDQGQLRTAPGPGLGVDWLSY